MKNLEGINIVCEYTGKICYTQREAGAVINNCRKHFYVGNHRWIKSKYSNSKYIPRRKYFCKECGYFHVTHNPYYKSDSHNGAWEEAFYKKYQGRA